MTPEHNMPTPAQIDALTSSEAGNLHIDLGIAVDQIKIAAKALATWTNRTYTAEDRQCLATHLEDARAILGEAQRLITLKTVHELEKQLKVNDCPPCSGTGTVNGKDCAQCFGTGGYYPNIV